MERINGILQHETYQEWLSRNEQAEKDRIFCRHDMDHNLAVARISYLLWLEQGGEQNVKPLFYAAALLHDIGKWQKAFYPQRDHGELSGDLARQLLPDCGFSPMEQKIILQAIYAHSGNDRVAELMDKKEKTFAEIFYLGDKLSRRCWECKGTEECYWNIKNETILY